MVATEWIPEKFWIAPQATRTIAATTESGSRMRIVPRTFFGAGAGVPTSAATAMRTAAETKFCTARPPVCTTWPMACSP